MKTHFLIFFLFLMGLLKSQEPDTTVVTEPDSINVQSPLLPSSTGSSDTSSAQSDTSSNSLGLQPPEQSGSTSDTSSIEGVIFPDSVDPQDAILNDPNPDTVLFEIKFTPAHRTVGFPTDTVLTIAFSKSVRNINDTPVSNEQISNLIALKSMKTNGPDVSFKADVNTEGTLVTIRPESELDDDQRFFFSLSAGLEDEFNNPIKPVTIRFSTKVKVALLDFTLPGLSSIENRSLLSYVRYELNATGVAMCLERQEMMDKLKENAIDPSGCQADDCAFEIGKALGVTNIVRVTFGRLEKSEDYVTERVVLSGDVAMRLLDVNNQKLKRNIHREFSGGLYHLGRFVRRMTWDLLKVEPTKERFGADVESTSLFEKIKNEVTELIASPREWVITHPEFAIGVGALLLLSVGATLVFGSQEAPDIGGPPNYPEVP